MPVDSPVPPSIGGMRGVVGRLGKLVDPSNQDGYMGRTVGLTCVSAAVGMHTCQPPHKCAWTWEPAMANENTGAAAQVAAAAAPAASAAGRADTFLEKVVVAAENLINLKIVTVVGDATLSGTLERPKVELSSDNSEGDQIVIATNINIIDSDITTVIPEKYENELGSAIMKYHTEKVTQANESMNQRIEFIKSLVKDIVPIIRGEDG